jgi:hypothetical protein
MKALCEAWKFGFEIVRPPASDMYLEQQPPDFRPAIPPTSTNSYPLIRAGTYSPLGTMQNAAVAL